MLQHHYNMSCSDSWLIAVLVWGCAIMCVLWPPHFLYGYASCNPYPSLLSFWTSSTVIPNMKMFSAPTSSLISTLAPSRVPIVSAPFAINFILPVPEASVPAVEICTSRTYMKQVTWHVAKSWYVLTSVL